MYAQGANVFSSMVPHSHKEHSQGQLWQRIANLYVTSVRETPPGNNPADLVTCLTAETPQAARDC